MAGEASPESLSPVLAKAASSASFLGWKPDPSTSSLSPTSSNLLFCNMQRTGPPVSAPKHCPPFSSPSFPASLVSQRSLHTLTPHSPVPSARLRTPLPFTQR